jgi:hypothetical protein
MTQEEKYGTRDRSYSAWHRRNSTKRFVGMEDAQLLAMIDLDASLYVEYDDGTKEPLALIETARDVGQAHKTATVTLNLARRADLPCFCVLYTLSDSACPGDNRWNDISQFRVKRLHPLTVAEVEKKTYPEWEVLSPDEWAKRLLKMRRWKVERTVFLDIQCEV